MCHMTMKLPAMFDPNPHLTFDKIVKKQLKQLKQLKTLSMLDLEPKCQVHSRNQKLMTWGTKNMPPQKNLSRGCLSNWCDADANSSETICPPPLVGWGFLYGFIDFCLQVLPGWGRCRTL